MRGRGGGGVRALDMSQPALFRITIYSSTCRNFVSTHAIDYDGGGYAAQRKSKLRSVACFPAKTSIELRKAAMTWGRLAVNNLLYFHRGFYS